MGAGETTWRLVRMMPREASTMKPVAVYPPNKTRRQSLLFLTRTCTHLMFQYQSCAHDLL